MEWLKWIIDKLGTEVGAVYIIGLLTVIVGLWQFQESYKQSKKASVFDDLSKDIQKAGELMDQINNDADDVVSYLAEAANLAKKPIDQKSKPDELNRRLQAIEDTTEKHKKFLATTFDSYRNVLLLIKKVEKSTMVGEGARRAARYLFYEADSQFALLNAARKVLGSFSVTPPLGESPSIGPETFNSFSELLELINQHNLVIGNYLDDLEVILHNDLVKGLHGKAEPSSLPAKHLTSSGLVDKRIEKSLL